MTSDKTPDMTGGLLGTALGGFAWMMIAGFTIGSPIASILAMIAAIACYMGGMTMFRANPKRRLMIIGLALIWLAFCNLLFVNFAYDALPESVGGIGTGKDVLSLFTINLGMAVIVVAGFVIVVRDFMHMKDQDPND